MDTLSTVFRLYGRIHGELKKDQVYMLNVQNNYDSDIFEGKKRLHFMSVNELGGDNIWLAILLIIFAVILLLIQATFFCCREN